MSKSFLAVSLGQKAGKLDVEALAKQLQSLRRLVPSAQLHLFTPSSLQYELCTNITPWESGRVGEGNAATSLLK